MKPPVGAHLEAAAQQFDALAHPEQATAGFDLADLAVVAHLDEDAVVVREQHPHPGDADAVAGDVGERLLHDAVGGRADRGGDVVVGELVAELDLGARDLRGRDETGDGVDAGLRCPRSVVAVGPQHAEHRPHVVQGGLARLLDRRERLGRLLRVACRRDATPRRPAR